MKCKDIMKSDVEYVAPDATMHRAAAVMRDTNVGFLPVCNESMQVVGTVTDRDITIRGVAEGRPENTPIRDLMSRYLVSCNPEDDLEHARELMAAHQKSRIVCLSSTGRLEGVISLSDIAQLGETKGIETLREVASRESRSDSLYAS
jgi:CBS domain-containing protein